MLRNLYAEQARLGKSDQDMADYLGITRQTYIAKKHSGNFSFPQIKSLLMLFNVSFEYLFDTKETS